MVDKSSLPLSTYFAWVGCILIFLGWLLSFFASFNTNIIFSIIIVPLAYWWLQHSADRNAVWYDKNEIMGELGAFAYLLSGFALMLGIYYLFSSHSSSNLINTFSPVLITLGGILLVLKFIINTYSNMAVSAYHISDKVDETRSIPMQAKHIIGVIFGVLLLVTGLILLIERNDIALEMVGQDVALKEAFFGGSSFQEAKTIVIIGSIVSLIGGSLLLIFGLVFGLKKK